MSYIIETNTNYDQLIEKIDRLAIELSPKKSKHMGRCYVHKERAVWKYKSFPLMGLDMTDEHIENIVASIQKQFPDCAITLSLGEKLVDVYERFFCAGANRYLLRHETYDRLHYRLLLNIRVVR